jgi:hypothetical protein
MEEPLTLNDTYRNGGNLTVENLYVARSKDLRLKAKMPQPPPEFEKEVARRYAGEDFSLRGPVKPAAWPAMSSTFASGSNRPR